METQILKRFLQIVLLLKHNELAQMSFLCQTVLRVRNPVCSKQDSDRIMTCWMFLFSKRWD